MGDRAIEIRCHGFVDGEDGRDLVVAAVLRDGRWLRGVARIERWNGAAHRVDAADLTWGEEGPRGELTVEALPDGWVPKDGRPVAGRVHLSGDGTWSGDFGGSAGTGTATCSEATAVAPEPETSELILEATPFPVAPEPADAPRYSLSLALRGGRIAACAVGATFCKRAHAFRPLAVEETNWEDGRFAVEAVGPVSTAEDDPVVDGSCRWRLSGSVVGETVVGRFELERPADDGTLRTDGGLYGRLVPVANDEAIAPIWPVLHDGTPWYLPVGGWRPVEPAEHPRLLLRRADLPRLRERAATPTGRAILGRLRHILGADGESLPEICNRHNVVGKGAKGPAELPRGAFTAWHCTGYATLHAATGEAHYADLARAALERLWQGVPDRDERYAWTGGVGGLRIGPVLEGAALTYDLCHDAWDPDFRREAVRRLQDYDDCDPEHRWSIDRLLFANGYPPGSNHYGAYVGGPGLVALALRGDAGADPERVERWLEGAHAGIVRALCYGFGDGGGFAEGHHPSRLAANSGLVGLLQAMRHACGRDYLVPRPHAAAITLRWVHLLTVRCGRPAFPHHGVYGGDEFDCRGLSHGGEFATGFGAIPPACVPALLWTWQHCVAGRQHDPDRADWLDAKEESFDVLTYPHRALYALVNWPLDVEPADPATVLPRVLADTQHGYVVTRNRWRDEGDLIVSVALDTGPRGYYRFSQGTPSLRVFGAGVDASLPLAPRAARVTAYRPAADGSLLLAWRDGPEDHRLAVDFSGDLDAELVLVHRGPAPTPEASGNRDSEAVHYAFDLDGETTRALVVARGAPPTVDALRRRTAALITDR